MLWKMVFEHRVKLKEGLNKMNTEKAT